MRLSFFIGLVFVVVEVGCGPIGTDDICSCPPIPIDGGPPGFDATFGDAADATDGMVTTTRASLCEIASCDPDNPAACGYHPDAGDAAVWSCRVDGAKAMCVAAGAGGDGETCTSGADCAPGYDCVGIGICRQYCCSGTCGESSFCDLGETTSLKAVPVCSPVQPCTPLAPSVCAAGEACTMVENGAQLVATCDSVGVGKRGDSCETTLCSAGFACLSAIGSRKCVQMCNATNACPVDLTCNLTTLGVGICGP